MSEENLCRFKLPGFENAGFATKEGLMKAIRDYPHLRPCPADKTDPNGFWNWVYPESCRKCPYKKLVFHTGPIDQKGGN